MGGKPRRSKVTRKEADMSSLKTLLAELDERTEPLCEHDIASSIKDLEEQSEHCRAEFLAFEFTEGFDHPNYFGYYFTAINEDGVRVNFPDISHVTSERIEYWSQRANACKHPILKARYSGLVWELSKKITKRAPDVSMARLRIDSVADIANRACHKYHKVVVTMLDHALQLAKRINDTARAKALCSVIVEYEARIAENQKGGTWGFSYDILCKKKNIGLTEEQKEKIIHDLEVRLERLSSPPDGSPPHPWAAEQAAVRLAEHYRASNASEDVRRVLLKYGSAFEPLCQSASPLMVSGWLQHVDEIYTKFFLTQESQQLRQRLRDLGPGMVSEFGSLSVPVSIKQEQIIEYIEKILNGDREDVVMRIAWEYLPLKGDAERQVRESAKDAPFLASITHELYDDQGRPLAKIGSVDEDFEARVLYQISQSMRFSAPFLRLTLRTWSEKFEWGSESLVSYLRCSPSFQDNRLPMLKEGANAYFSGNALVATHLWIPQVEEAIRLLAKLTGGSVLKPNRNGGQNLKNLDELLREAKVLETLGVDVVWYFRALFTGPRGWNLRNDICHGLLAAENVTLEMADRVLHSLLILGALREKPADDGEDQDVGEEK